MVETLMHEIREKQHDYHNHLQSLIAMLENNAIHQETNVDGYITELRSDDVLPSITKLNNQVLIALIYSKYKEALDNGIDITLRIGIQDHESSYTDYELVEIYGILLDNAIEATKELDEKKIELMLVRDTGKNKIILKNSTADLSMDDVDKFFKKGYSSKGKENRGIGLTKLQKLLKRHKGIITASYDTSKHLLTFEVIYS